MAYLITTPSELNFLQSLSLPFELLTVSGVGEAVVFTTATGEIVAAHVVYCEAIGAAVCRGDKTELDDLLAQYWRTTFGNEGSPKVFEVKTAEDRAAFLDALFLEMGAVQSRLSQRNVILARALSEVRKSYEETQNNFEKLETYLFIGEGAERRLARRLTPLSGGKVISLKPGGILEQRLPMASAGLSDVSLFLRNVPKFERTDQGVLHVELCLLGDGTLAAEWKIAASDLKNGLQRFSMVRALSSDAQTVALRLSWDGTQPLTFAPSVPHPDPRFCATGSDHCLALHLWCYLPGAIAPAAADAIMETYGPEQSVWTLNGHQFANATGLGASRDEVQFDEGYGALVVPAKSPEITAARLDRCGKPNCRFVRYAVKTEDKQGPEVSYAIAVLPSRLRESSSVSIPDFSLGQISEWRTVATNSWREAQWFLPQPLAEECDVFLLTRLPSGQTAETPPKSCFYPLSFEVV